MKKVRKLLASQDFRRSKKIMGSRLRSQGKIKSFKSSQAGVEIKIARFHILR